MQVFDAASSMLHLGAICWHAIWTDHWTSRRILDFAGFLHASYAHSTCNFQSILFRVKCPL